MDRMIQGSFVLRNRLRAAIDDGQLRALVAFAAGPVALGSGVLVELGLTRSLDGHAEGFFRSPPYGWDSAGHPEVRYFLRAAFPNLRSLLSGHHWPCESSYETFPMGSPYSHLKQVKAYGQSRAVRLHGLHEEIIYLFGREIWHLEQHRRDEASGWRRYARADGSTDHDLLEREAESVGRDRLAAFRRMQDRAHPSAATPALRYDPMTLGSKMREIALRPEHLGPLSGLGWLGWLDEGSPTYSEAVRLFLGNEVTLACVIVEGEGYGPIVDHSIAIAFEHVFDGEGATPLEGYLGRYTPRGGRSDVSLEIVHNNDLGHDRDIARQIRNLWLQTMLARELARTWRAELS